MPSVITAALGFVLLAAGLAGAKSNSIGLGAPAAKTGEYEKYADLLKRSGKLAGRTDKSGMLPYDKWSEKHFNRSHGADFSQWLQRSIGGRTSGKDLVPPLTRMCGVWVNHKYKVIFVRNRKAASTSIVIALGKPCEPGQGPNAHCMHKVHDADTFLKAGVTPEEAWKDYFVFGVSRNPWARAASGYDYAQRKDDNPEMYYSPERSASCKLRHYEFDEFCANPMSIALQSFKQGCPGWIGKVRGGHSGRPC